MRKCPRCGYEGSESYPIDEGRWQNSTIYLPMATEVIMDTDPQKLLMEWEKAKRYMELA